MSNPLKDITYLFFPHTCPVCNDEMPEGSKVVCTKCRWNAPLTDYWKEIDNPVVRKFWGIIPVVNASAFFFYVKGSGFAELIHSFKYYGKWRQAVEMGEWFGGELLRSGLYQNIDVVIPVPLHMWRKFKRGYNQSEYIARGIASQLKAEVDTRSVVRSRHNTSQTHKDHHERWDNVEGIFSVRRKNHLDGKHILLVDDVLTTGATISSCAEAIINAVPNCQISIVTLAVSRSDIEAV